MHQGTSESRPQALQGWRFMAFDIGNHPSSSHGNSYYIKEIPVYMPRCSKKKLFRLCWQARAAKHIVTTIPSHRKIILAVGINTSKISVLPTRSITAQKYWSTCTLGFGHNFLPHPFEVSSLLHYHYLRCIWGCTAARRIWNSVKEFEMYLLMLVTLSQHRWAVVWCKYRVLEDGQIPTNGACRYLNRDVSLLQGHLACPGKNRNTKTEYCICVCAWSCHDSVGTLVVRRGLGIRRTLRNHR